MTELRITGIPGIKEVAAGDDVARLIFDAAGDGALADRDVLVVAQKIVSKAEGRLVPVDDRAEAINNESLKVLRRSGEMLISETRHGFVCANAGVDASNVPEDTILLLPLDPDLSARRIRSRIAHLCGADVGVVISDTFGRAWRLGQTNIAIGVAGFQPFNDYVGTTDSYGRPLAATRICSADELAGAAELVMGKAEGVPAAIVRGAPVAWGFGSARDIVRPAGEDLFR